MEVRREVDQARACYQAAYELYTELDLRQADEVRGWLDNLTPAADRSVPERAP